MIVCQYHKKGHGLVMVQNQNLLPYVTPYILFFFGLIMSIIGVLIRMAITNMQQSIDKAIKSVEQQSVQISELLLAKELHKMRIENHATEIAFIKSRLELRPKTDKINEVRP